MKDRKVILSTLWIFAIANYIYCDILSHMNPEFLKVLLGEGQSNRVINMIAGSLMTLVQIGSLFIGTPEYHYFFYSIIEIATTAFIVVYAWKWRNPEMA